MKKTLGRLFYVHTEMAGALFMLFGAALELACGAALGWDHPIAILAWHAAVLFIVAAVCMLWSVYRFEQKYNR